MSGALNTPEGEEEPSGQNPKHPTAHTTGRAGTEKALIGPTTLQRSGKKATGTPKNDVKGDSSPLLQILKGEGSAHHHKEPEGGSTGKTTHILKSTKP